MAYFASRYKEVVQKELSSENAGLALRWSEWPGKTRILIPLGSGAAKGRLGAVDTGADSGKEVTEGFRAQPDKGVADRQAMVDIKEREAQQRQAEADKQKADLAAAEKKLAEDKAKAEADRAALEKEKAAAATGAAPSAEKASAAPGGTAADSGAASAAAPDAALATKEAAVKAEEEKVAKEEAAVAAKKEEAAKAQDAAAVKQAEAAAERKDITVDQKAAIAAEVEAKGRSEVAGVFLVLVADDSAHLAQLAFVDSEKGAPIRRSRITTLHLRSLVELADAFAAVSGLEGKPGGVKLVKLDKASLESVAESAAEAYPESAVLVDGDALYAIVKAGDGKYYPARFSAADLKETARSKVAVMPHTALSRVGSGIAVQTPAGAFAVLKADTLEKTKDLKP
jgi:chemotaxis protein histidine kinase CheA